MRQTIENGLKKILCGVGVVQKRFEVLLLDAVKRFDGGDLIFKLLRFERLFQACADEHVIFGRVFEGNEFEEFGRVAAAFKQERAQAVGEGFGGAFEHDTVF